MNITPYELLDRKRRGVELNPDEVRGFVAGFVDGSVAEYQMSAFLMAAAIHGLSKVETSALTTAMLESGEQWKLRDSVGLVADKHSTGGVGDKVSLVIAPLLAACGVQVAMLSGRGLGHTGGTLDKLEAIPGFRARLTRVEMEEVLAKCGCVIATSTDKVAPADRRMYALRDVTGTVESIPLITASIMSKKLALGASALILDVKFGSGAFMKTLEDAELLATGLVEVGRAAGISVEAILSSMEAPLGVAVGNTTEVIEALDLLRGHGPSDAMEVCLAQSERVLVMAGRNPDEARGELERAISSGAAIEAARRWLEAQGGDPSIVDSPERLTVAPVADEVRAGRSGFMGSMDTREIGMCLVALGGGRVRQEDQLDPSCGIRILAKPGDNVAAGQIIAEVLASESRPDLVHRIGNAMPINDAPEKQSPLIARMITEAK